MAGLLALLLLHDARRAARATADGELVPLEQQDRSRWDRAAIEEGCALAEAALSRPGFGAYALQAAIAAVHAEAPSAAATDWPQIVGLYDALLRVEPSPVIALNRAVAVACATGRPPGCTGRAASGAAARLPRCRGGGRVSAAGRPSRGGRDALPDGHRPGRQEPERRFLARRLAEVEG